jgi:hypothetical protein
VNTKLEGSVSINTQVVFPELQKRNLMNTVVVRDMGGACSIHGEIINSSNLIIELEAKKRIEKFEL